MVKYEKAFVYYATEKYIDIAKKSIGSIRKYTDTPIFLYLLNLDLNLDINNVFTVRWDCDISINDDMYDISDDKNFFIDRKNKNIYKILIQRPKIISHCIENFAKTVCYVDCDSIATPYVENIFTFFDHDSPYPYFVDGIYDYLGFYGRGAVLPIDEKQSNTLEYPICELLNSNQKNRVSYRQTGYFVANENCIDFLNEWSDACNHPKVLDNPEYYAPYHEETIVNAILWKYDYQESLPYCYVNGSLVQVDEVYNKIKFTGNENDISELYKIPKNKHLLLFFHGEKRLNIMDQMIEDIKKFAKTKILFLAPHLSTGGMPAFLLKRIEEIKRFYSDVEIFVAEYSFYGDAYVVHRNKIIELVGKDHFFELDSNKEILIDIIKDNGIDIIHIDENIEMLSDPLPETVLNQIYSIDRPWRIIETCHNIWFDANNNKRFNPDGYIFCTPWHKENTFSNLSSPSTSIQFPIENKKPTKSQKEDAKKLLGFDLEKTHVINVGLWTRGKNQGEMVEVAKLLEKTNPEIVFHFIGNQAGNFQDYWEPIMSDVPSNVKIWKERNDVELFLRAADIMMFNSTLECNPLVLRESMSHYLKIIARPLDQYMGQYDNYIYPIKSNNVNDIKNLLLEVINSDNKYGHVYDDEDEFSKNHMKFYAEVLRNNPIKQDIQNSKVQIIHHFVDNPYIEIKGESNANYTIKVFDENDNCVYQNIIRSNHWIKLNRQFYTKWKTKIYENNKLIYDEVLNLKNKRVFISIESKSLGDTLAWMPYVEEFRKTHGCHLIVSTHLNNLFYKQYPNIEFVDPATVIHDLYALYRIGWFYGSDNQFNSNRHPIDFKTIPLQKTATDILGLEFKEIKPKLNLPQKDKKKKVGFGIHSTSQAKYWNNPNGWQEVVNYLNSLGYECILYSKENDGYMGNNHPKGIKKFKGGSIQDVINDLATCEFFVGIGSGLSWLAWSCNLPIVLISGFSHKFTETQSDTYRVINENVCHGCFNWSRLDAGDWNWCPLHKGTDKVYECTKKITSEMVIEKIQELVGSKKSVYDDFDWGWMNNDNPNSVFHKNAMTNEIFENQIYEKYFSVEGGDIVVDVGSSVGPFIRSIVDKKPKHVFCLEPSESEFKTLVKNTIGYPVTQINKGITSTNGVIQSDQLFGGEVLMEGITFDRFLTLYNIDKIDFLKLDCEGGEYDIFNKENLEFIKSNVKKIAGEWHLGGAELKKKFVEFRDEILINFDRYEISSIDGCDIKWDLFNQHFLDYYTEVIVYIDNT